MIVLSVIVLAGCGDSSTQSAENSDNTGAEGSSTNNADQSLKKMYEEKLNTARKQSEALQAEDDTTYSLRKTENDRWSIWDSLLNEIYGDLEKLLSEKEMDALRLEQRDWIKERDNQALKASLIYEGGTMEALEYIRVFARLTEERCYALVEKYVK